MSIDREFEAVKLAAHRSEDALRYLLRSWSDLESMQLTADRSFETGRGGRSAGSPALSESAGKPIRELLADVRVGLLAVSLTVGPWATPPVVVPVTVVELADLTIAGVAGILARWTTLDGATRRPLGKAISALDVTTGEWQSRAGKLLHGGFTAAVMYGQDAYMPDSREHAALITARDRRVAAGEGGSYRPAVPQRRPRARGTTTAPSSSDVVQQPTVPARGVRLARLRDAAVRRIRGDA